jgi:hypothetical protein
MKAEEARRLKELEQENSRLKRLLAAATWGSAWRDTVAHIQKKTESCASKGR